IPDHRGTEEALAASGLPYTALRNSLYSDLLPASVPRALASGVHASNSGEGGTSYVSRADLAAATAALLADPSLPGPVLELSWPPTSPQSRSDCAGWGPWWRCRSRGGGAQSQPPRPTPPTAAQRSRLVCSSQRPRGPLLR